VFVESGRAGLAPARTWDGDGELELGLGVELVDGHLLASGQESLLLRAHLGVDQGVLHIAQQHVFEDQRRRDRNHVISLGPFPAAAGEKSGQGATRRTTPHTRHAAHDINVLGVGLGLHLEVDSEVARLRLGRDSRALEVVVVRYLLEALDSRFRPAALGLLGGQQLAELRLAGETRGAEPHGVGSRL
jgi:hypothetical protein